ncbi:MAG: hypothetical protein V3S01_02525, partial [Dehalococcoidia bacterium]
MHHFHYRGEDLYCEEVPITALAGEVGTPFYLYSHATLTRHFRREHSPQLRRGARKAAGASGTYCRRAFGFVPV